MFVFSPLFVCRITFIISNKYTIPTSSFIFPLAISMVAFSKLFPTSFFSLFLYFSHLVYLTSFLALSIYLLILFSFSLSLSILPNLSLLNMQVYLNQKFWKAFVFHEVQTKILIGGTFFNVHFTKMILSQNLLGKMFQIYL